jgi:uncharacterized protein YcfJ
MNTTLAIALAIAGLTSATLASAQVTFYEREGFEGRSFTTSKPVQNFERLGFNDRASSVVVTRGDRWEVCENARFEGRCVVLRPGNYPSLAAIGLNDRVSSVRAVGGNSRIEDGRYAPAPLVAHDYRRRRDERTFDAPVTEVRAVLGPPEQRCWVQRGELRDEPNVGAGIAGAVIGGILGHQVGSGRGNDLATAGGAVAGGAIGYNSSRFQSSRDVQRCREVPSQAGPAYWDVTYNFRGRDHTVQMATRPGDTIRVNANGEPRA